MNNDRDAPRGHRIFIVAKIPRGRANNYLEPMQELFPPPLTLHYGVA